MQTAGTILRRTAGTAIDIYGEPTRGTTSVAVLCEIQQRRTEEPGEAGEFSIANWDGFFPSGTAIDTGDAVVAPTKGTFEVIGEPWDAEEGSAAVNHVEVALKRTVGAA